jgi:hypothetical protein
MCTNLTSTGGVVQSPNYPGDYGNGDGNCQITITAPAGWMIQLNFTTFNLETDVAYVQVTKRNRYILNVERSIHILFDILRLAKCL